MAELQFPDYQNSIANLACSILRHFGVESPNATLPAADRLLETGAGNVVVILVDGMGVRSLETHLAQDGFFRRHLQCEYSSTFPPTTVAATTAMDSGLFPNQSAWLGWTGYFREVDRNLVYFWNQDADTGEPLPDAQSPRVLAPYASVHDLLGRAGVASHFLARFLGERPQSFSELCGLIQGLCAAGGRRYVYAYWDEPDASMHETGVDGENIRGILEEVEAETERLAARLSDTLLLVTADHGHINVNNRCILDEPDICRLLTRMPSIEARAVNLFVKPGQEARFEETFCSRFGEEFLLLTKEEVLDRQLLGTGPNHPRLSSMLGQYLAIGIGDTALPNNRKGYKGNHAGLTRAEMRIPLIAVACNGQPQPK